jgi:aerobic C4-dicarboxylate transport protein
MALILGIDRFMSECRALTNFVGNAVATIVVARWEGELDQDQLARVLSGKEEFTGIADVDQLPASVQPAE